MRELPAAVPRDKVQNQISLIIVPPADTRTSLSIPVWRRPGALCYYLLSLVAQQDSRVCGPNVSDSWSVCREGELNPDWPLVSDFSTVNLLFSLSTLSRSLSLSLVSPSLRSHSRQSLGKGLGGPTAVSSADHLASGADVDSAKVGTAPWLALSRVQDG